jgi:hypothetical protein
VPDAAAAAAAVSDAAAAAVSDAAASGAAARAAGGLLRLGVRVADAMPKFFPVRRKLC